MNAQTIPKLIDKVKLSAAKVDVSVVSDGVVVGPVVGGIDVGTVVSGGSDGGGTVVSSSGNL